MGVERELKFAVSQATAQALPQHPLLLLDGAVRRRRLHTRYFDTEDLQLGAAGMVLRVRDSDGARVVTVKSRGDDALGAVRQEWEWATLDAAPGPLPGPRDLRHALRQTALAGLGLGEAQLRARLAPRFATRFERSTWEISWGDARIELALDQGVCEAAAEGREVATELCEIELEVLQGSLLAAWDLAWTLAQDLPLRLSPVDKAWRAASLLRGQRPQAAPEPAPLAPDASLQQAMRQWLQTACAQLSVWAERIGSADEARDVHQFRVVLRRLRTALRWLQGQLPRGAANWLRGELRWAHQLAGPLRDADVALDLLGRADVAGPASAAQARALREQLAQQRARQRDALLAYLQGARFGRLLLALGRCAECELRGAHGGAALRRLAAQALRQDARRWHEALRECEAWLREALLAPRPAGEQAARLHALRIASKQLRLSTERMAGVLPRKQRRDFAQQGRLATTLQNRLGEWHDAERLLQHAREHQPRARQLQSWLEQQASQALQGAAQAACPPPRSAKPRLPQQPPAAAVGPAEPVEAVEPAEPPLLDESTAAPAESLQAVSEAAPIPPAEASLQALAQEQEQGA